MTEKEFKEAIEKFFYKQKETTSLKRSPSIKHNTWEEDGKAYSSWTIDSGENIAITGDGGIELFLEAFKKEAKKFGNLEK